MDSVKIIIFDEENLTQTLIENYLEELIFPYEYEKYGEFDDGLITNSAQDKIIIVNINKLNTDILEKMAICSKNKKNNFMAISYDDSTDLRVRILRAGAKDFLLKPLIKSDFIYSIQQLYKKYILKTNKTDNCCIFSILSNENNKDISFFITYLAKETENILKEKILIIDIPQKENYIASLYNFNSQSESGYKPSQNLFLRYKNSSTYLLNLNPDKLNTNYIQNLLNILKPEYKCIFINLSGNFNNQIKNDFINETENILYLSSMNFSIDKLKEELNLYCKNKKTKLILNKYEIRNKMKIKKVQFNIGRTADFVIPQNCIALERSVNNGMTLNEYNTDFEISQKYVNLAKEITDRI